MSSFNTSHVVIYLYLSDWSYPILLCFNTSHVVIYRVCQHRKSGIPARFNTSHVVIYRHHQSSCIWQGVSIHLMLLFIRCRIVKRQFLISVSIHLMLLFIKSKSQQWTLRWLVSIHLMLLFIEVFKKVAEELESFQYISCCYLSNMAVDALSLALTFQYISCCYLSFDVAFQLVETFSVSIHLMLLFICITMRIFWFVKSFNTSHVVIYRYKDLL